MSLLRNERGLRGDRTDSPRVAFYQVDTFTTKVFTGNPAGVVLNGVSLTRSQMQRIARELNNSETAFVLPGNGDGEPVHVDVGERAVIAYRGELALR